MPSQISDPDKSSKNKHPPKSGVAETTSVETVPKRRRRVFTAADKLRIVKTADGCLASGKRGALEAMLRREGIFSSV
jgi:hypothetical protein